MTSEPLYKVALRYDAISADHLIAVAPYPIAAAEARQAYLDHAEDKNRELALPLYERAMAWLDNAEKRDTFVNCYDNTDHAKGNGLMVIVLNDRTTALLLKLALS